MYEFHGLTRTIVPSTQVCTYSVAFGSVAVRPHTQSFVYLLILIMSHNWKNWQADARTIDNPRNTCTSPRASSDFFLSPLRLQNMEPPLSLIADLKPDNKKQPNSLFKWLDPVE